MNSTATDARIFSDNSYLVHSSGRKSADAQQWRSGQGPYTGGGVVELGAGTLLPGAGARRADDNGRWRKGRAGEEEERRRSPQRLSGSHRGRGRLAGEGTGRW
jgi:hypothetical protein